MDNVTTGVMAEEGLAYTHRKAAGLIQKAVGNCRLSIRKDGCGVLNSPS